MGQLLSDVEWEGLWWSRVVGVGDDHRNLSRLLDCESIHLELRSK